MGRPVLVAPGGPRQLAVTAEGLVARSTVEAADTPMVGPVTPSPIAAGTPRQTRAGGPRIVIAETAWGPSSIGRPCPFTATVGAPVGRQNTGAAPAPPELVFMGAVAAATPDPPAPESSARLVAPREARPRQGGARGPAPRIKGVPRPKALTDTPVMVPARPVAPPGRVRRSAARARLLTGPIARAPRERVPPEMVGRAPIARGTVVTVLVAPRFGAHRVLNGPALAVPAAPARALGPSTS